jgi:hypothetical protein
MNAPEVKRALESFGHRVIKDARTNLTKLGKNATNELYDSFKSEVNAYPNSFQFTMTAEDYWEYQDKGVSGIITKYTTPFSYKERQAGTLKGMPPPSAFDKWNVIRGRAGRSTLGTFLPRKSLNFATAVSVFKHGIKPTAFLSTPFEQSFNRLPQELIEAYALDASNFLKQAFRK